ncbi:MAG TPA: hypothetical protein VGP08_19060 [Pyrinomonadaceae bacterium]|nr:hypothetical protein [Pyrinomonadaceae bacterium]
MSAILIISVILAFVAAASFAILRTRRPRSNADAELLPPYGARTLFADADGARLSLPDIDEDAASEDFERELRERASRGDLETLKEARESGRAELYNLILAVLLERSEGDAVALRALADFVARGEDLRSTPALAAAALEDFEREPARSGVPTLLRVAALSDDAAAFERAMTAVLRARLEGRLADSNAEELRTLFDAEYWLLSSEARRSGAGFQLKQKLAQVRRSLADNERRRPTPFGEPAPAGDAAQKERQ